MGALRPDQDAGLPVGDQSEPHEGEGGREEQGGVSGELPGLSGLAWAWAAGGPPPGPGAEEYAREAGDKSDLAEFEP